MIELEGARAANIGIENILCRNIEALASLGVSPGDISSESLFLQLKDHLRGLSMTVINELLKEANIPTPDRIPILKQLGNHQKNADVEGKSRGAHIEHDDIQVLRWYHITPGINFLYDAFFDSAMSIEEVERTLQLFALVDALMLSIAFAFPCSVEFDEIQDALSRWSDQGSVEWSYCSNTTGPHVLQEHCKEILKGFNGYATFTAISLQNGAAYVEGFLNAEWYIYGFAQYAAASISLFSSSLLVVTFIYMSMVSTSFKDSTDRFNVEMHLAWWSVIRFLVFFSFIFMSAGIVSLFFTMHRLMFIKFPSPSIETTAKASGDPTIGDPVIVFANWSWVGILGISFLSVVLISAAYVLKVLEYLRARNIKPDWSCRSLCCGKSKTLQERLE